MLLVRLTMPSPVLVTGATGHLGSAVCSALVAAGFVVRATDRRFDPSFPMDLELGDLLDEIFVHRVVRGCHAIVHLGNHPNAFVGLSPQRLLSENVAMNANVFQAAADLGVRAIVFASSVQTMIRREKQVSGPPYAIPYLPLDGRPPPNPGRNTYALSKEFAERMLRLMVEADPGLQAVSLRFPMLVTEQLAKRMRSRRIPLDLLDLAEGTAHLFLPDAGRLVAALIARHRPGYHQYFPATAMQLHGIRVEELLAERYSDVPLRRPIDDFASLIDASELERDLGWTPTERLHVTVERSAPPG